jgi:1-deoxy-D-xylulose-5-phosphate reductoisomerase
MKRNIAILGCTGSIGKSTIDIIMEKKDEFQVTLINSTGCQQQDIAKQAQALQPLFVGVDRQFLEQTRQNLAGLTCKVFCNDDIKNIISGMQFDAVSMGICGFQALKYCILFAKCSKMIALANKEAVICGWFLLKEVAKAHNCRIIPVDSEHNSIYQLLLGYKKQDIHHIAITASGGPFLNFEGDMSTITPQMATAHPKWKMGTKISTDSATLINKGIEVIEASMLFDLPLDMIHVYIHPQSIVHALVSAQDSSTYALFAVPDMRFHIASALYYNAVPKFSFLEPLNLAKIGKFEFFEINHAKFPGFQICIDAAQTSLAHVISLNAANEVIVEAFLQEKIAFTQIPIKLEKVVSAITASTPIAIEDVISIDINARNLAKQTI